MEYADTTKQLTKQVRDNGLTGHTHIKHTYTGLENIMHQNVYTNGHSTNTRAANKPSDTNTKAKVIIDGWFG